jgi:hypothetical protein
MLDLTKLADLPDGQLCRLYRRVCLRIRQRLSGGLTFGVDMPTLRAVLPGMAVLVVAIAEEGRRRGL